MLFMQCKRKDLFNSSSKYFFNIISAINIVPIIKCCANHHKALNKILPNMYTLICRCSIFQTNRFTCCGNLCSSAANGNDDTIIYIVCML